MFMITNNTSWSPGAAPNKNVDLFALFICSPSPGDPFSYPAVSRTGTISTHHYLATSYLDFAFGFRPFRAEPAFIVRIRTIPHKNARSESSGPG